ncbi:hypothetical protein NA78x_002597 [Anatilimnocola sp. NA78]|uniref:hypothetical protein n=1 Tax=Anatilimnocola sp. NA78 TaxID=3415683 RepID=UPI003CE4C325
MEPKVSNGHLHAPFFIFLRRDPELSDQQILGHFGLRTHRYSAKLPPFSTYVVLADVGDWTMLADDWLYQLWHLPSTKAAIESLAKDRDVFAWSIGDCDESFEYCLYINGQLIRHYVVDSPHFDDQVVRVELGQRLRFESELLASDLPIVEKMIRMGANLGINVVVKQEMLRIYSRPHKFQLDPNAAIRNF